MKLGDLLELFGFLCVCAGIYLYLGLAASLIALGAVLVYEGTCFGTTPLKVKRPTRPKWLKGRSGRKGS